MKARRLPTIVLLLLSLALVGIRTLAYHEAFERDLTIYAVIAHEMLGGRPLYSDMWDIKPPGVYLVYAAAELVAGYGRNQIFLLGAGAALVTLFGIYRAVLEFTEDKAASLWAAGFWALICSDIDLLANQPNAEVFMNAAFIWGLFWFLRARKTSFESDRLLLAAGCLWALGSYVKQVAFMVPLLLGITLLCQPKSLSWAKKAKSIGVLWLPTFGLWSGTLAYFAATGRLDIFIFSLVKFGKIYVGEGSQTTAAVSPFALVAPKELVCLAPLVLLVWVALVLTRNKLSKNWGLVAVVALSTQVAISLPGFYHLHYYQLWLPVLSWIAGFVVAQLRGVVKKPIQANWIVWGVTAALLALQLPKWTLTPDQVSVRKYGSPLFVHLFAMAPRIDAVMKPNETLYQYGYDPEFYFVTKRHPPVGILSLGAPNIKLPDWFQDRIIGDLERKNPDLALVDVGFAKSRISNYVFRNYSPLPRRKGEEFLLMTRRGSDIERRLKAMPVKNWP